MATGTWIYEKGSVTGGGGGTGGGGAPAPDVSIVGSADVIFRSDHRVEVDIDWTAAPTATAANFLGVAVYLEDPDISTGANHVLDGGSMPLDGTAQVSGEWAPVRINDSVKSPAVLFLDSVMGSTFGQSYKAGRDVRFYLAAYGPSSHPRLVRATDTTPTPNIMVFIPKGRSQGESGQEWAFLVTLPGNAVQVITDYNRLVPKYYLTLRYNPPDPSIPVPPGINHFGGCRIVFVHEDANGDPIFPGSDTGMSIPVAQADSGFKSDIYEPSPEGGKFRVYFCSEDDSQPLGSHINSLVEGTTPYAYAIVPAVAGTPDVTAFTISGQKISWLLDGSMIAEALFSWHLPDDKIRYAGVFLYLVKVTGGATTLTPFPQDLTGPQSNTAVNYPKDVSDVPKTPETWTIAAISYDINGKLADDPKKFGQSTFHSPIVTWDIGPPTPGSKGSGTEYAPLVTLGPGAAATDSQSLSSDGVNMVSFKVGPWVNPDDNKFGNAQIAMVVNHDTTKPTFYTVPVNATSFQTPSIPSFGNIGSPVTVEFFLISDDPQGHKNDLVVGTTPKIPFTYTPAAGAIIPSRTGWFDESQFTWVSDAGGLHADNIEAKNIYVGRTLVVGGAPDTSFAGQGNGQIAVKNSAGQLRAWMGEQQPGQGTGPGLWGGWFGQIWIGGTNPLDAPLWIDNAGIIQVGGIAARQGARYPYLSIRDQTGLEQGRIGASLNVPSGSVGDNVGGSPPNQLTSGAWFSQLAVGGSNLSNWNVLITPDTSKPLGSLFQMRNIYTLTIDYAAQFGNPANNHYILEFGSNVWTGGGIGTQWQFPGIHIYEVDGVGNGFGAVYLNRGMVLRGTQGQGYQVLASLVTYQGNSSGSDSPNDKFWGELAMYSPLPNYARTVYLASGGDHMGSPTFVMSDVSGNLLFSVDTGGNTSIKGVLQGAPVGGTNQPINALAYAVNGYGTVVDATGAWKGKPIASGALQTPWMSAINGAGFALTNAGNISAAQYFVNALGSAVIDTAGTFRGNGVDVGSGRAVYCSVLATNQYAGQNAVYTGTVNASGIITASDHYEGGQFRGGGVACQGYGIGCSYLQLYGGNIDGVGTMTSNAVNTGTVNSSGGYTGGSFRGAGVAVGGQGIGCGSISVSGPDGASSACTVNGAVNCVQLKINGTQRIDSNGIYHGGLQYSDHVYGGDFGIFGFVVGLASGGFYDRDGNFHGVRGGLITS